ncbi:MAG: type IV secretion system protein [Candidatus Accumulibacter sp.]|jgi:type IV secretion system protein VirB6|nr:type IV secretion system protein [Accumulibacter sp.]
MATDVIAFRFVGDTVTNAITKFVEPAANNLIGSLGAIAIGGVTLYFVLQGFAIISGAVQEPFSNLLKSCAKFIIIAAFALNAGNYATWITGTFDGLESGLAAALNKNSAPDTPLTIYGTLDSTLSKGFDLTGTCYEYADEAGVTSFGTMLSWWGTGLLIAGCTILLALAGGAVILTAKFALALLFAIGPLFIMCLMWPPTARFFDSWFGQVLNYILTVVFLGVIMTFAVAAYDGCIAKTSFTYTDQNPMFGALQIGGITGILLFLIYQVGGMASALAGGVSMAAMTLRQAASPITGAASGLASRINPVSTRRDAHTGEKVTDTRLGHIAKGNTPLNPAYLRGLKQNFSENFGKNWKKPPGGDVTKG